MSRYKPVQEVTTIKLDVRGLQYAVHTWGQENKTPVILLHGWADTGLSFQFLADVLAEKYYLIAPDWRGFGDTAWASQGYWFPDYLADLDTLLDVFHDDSGARIAGHSMGGNVACLYAGARPERVSHLASLDVYGLPATLPDEAPRRYAQWLDQLKQVNTFSSYSDIEKLMAHISSLAPGINDERARFIAESWSKPVADGQGFSVKVDPAHKRVNPVLYRREEALSCWRNIRARTLLVYGEDSRFYKRYCEDGYREECQQNFTDLSEDTIAAASHMLHLQQPERLAEKLHAFFSA